MASFEDVREEVTYLVKSRGSGLVLGAGASVSSGAPPTDELVELIKKRFPKASDDTNLFTVCDSVIHHPLYGRIELARFVKSQFDTLSPSECYKQLPRVHWRALFTTNYDDLIEQAYVTPSRVQTLQARNLGDAAATIPREGQLLFFYLMETIRQDMTGKSFPVLSWDDFLSTERHRSLILDLFKSILLDGAKIIYVGYSFNDFVFSRILDQSIREIGVRNQPHGYAILRDLPNSNDAAYHKLVSLKFQPVQGTFADLCEVIKDVAGDVGPGANKESPAGGSSVRIAGHVVRLPDDVASVIEESFRILSDKVTESKVEDSDAGPEKATSFLEGSDFGWLPYRKDWDFSRSSL